MWNIREGILDALADDDESIVQIDIGLRHARISFNRNQVFEMLQQLFIENKIKIAFPPRLCTIKKLKIKDIDDYWFSLTKEGRNEHDKISDFDYERVWAKKRLSEKVDEGCMGYKSIVTNSTPNEVEFVNLNGDTLETIIVNAEDIE